MHEQSVTPLAYRPPFRWDAIFKFLSTRAIEALESFANDRYQRGAITIEQDGETLRMTVSPHDPRPTTDDPVNRARHLFDLNADPSAIDAHLSKDRKLRPLIARRPGTRVPGAWEPFEIAVRAIVGQQISVRATTTIMNRLASILSPQQLADADVPGMPRSRADAIRSMARAVAGDPTLLARGRTLEETIDRLTALRGIGPWTAHYIAMRALGHTDAFPDSDLGLRKAAVTLGIGKLRDRAERWRPFRAYAAILLWETL